MNEPQQPKSARRILRRILMALAILATLIAIFYTEEDWRGKRAWESCQRQLEAQGVVLDWDKFIPPPVPDDQNFFKAPKMEQWFRKTPPGVAPPVPNELSALVTNAEKVAVITNKTVAANFLAWSDQFQPDFDLMRDALKRPYERADGNYVEPYLIPIPDFVDVRAVVQALAQRAKCELLLGQPDKALTELTLLNDSRRIMEREPTGKPMTLLDGMINVAVTGPYVNTIANGLQRQAWQEPQLAALQEQLEQINLPPFVVLAFQSETASTKQTLETMPLTKLAAIIRPDESRWQKIKDEKLVLAPRGWVYQNLAIADKFVCEQLSVFNAESNLIQPEQCRKISGEMAAVLSHSPHPYVFILAKVGPNCTRAWQVTAYNQTLVNEAQIACALERFRLAYGEYPDTLDSLAPKFMATIPHDIIGGRPLHYRRTSDGKFLLYSIGWNETDDGGKEGPHNEYGVTDYSKGDWVWPATAK